MTVRPEMARSHPKIADGIAVRCIRGARDPVGHARMRSHPVDGAPGPVARIQGDDGQDSPVVLSLPRWF